MRALECTRHALLPATSQIIDLVITLLLFFPESQVLLEKLDDALSIAEVVLLELVNLVEGLLKSTVSELTSLCMVLKYFIVEDREVEGEAKLNWVASWKIDRVCLLVGLLGLLLNFLKFGFLGVLCDVTVVVTDHLHEESFGLISAFACQDTGIDHIDNLLTVLLELFFDLILVGEESLVELCIFWVLLDGGNSAAGGTFARNKVLEGNRKQVALVGVDGATFRCEHLLEEVDHIFKAFGLFGNSCKEDFFFNVSSHLNKF